MGKRAIHGLVWASGGIPPLPTTSHDIRISGPLQGPDQRRHARGKRDALRDERLCKGTRDLSY